MKLEEDKIYKGSSRGFSLVELMVGVVILTVAFVSLSGLFRSISKSILVNKTKTIATNLAQEKIESLKNMSYFRLLVTTTSITDPNFGGMIYDMGTTQSYYPEETLTVGGSVFKRRVLVEFVKQFGEDLIPQPWTGNDTGLKKISVYVVWEEEGYWKKVELNNLKNNPNRADLDFTFNGTVSMEASGSPIYNATVETLQNPAYFSRTDINGRYSFKVQPGTYTLKASATGYFMSVSTNYSVGVGMSGAASHDFDLTKMAQGSVKGEAYIQDHLIITQIVASTDTATDINAYEWVELFNPTPDDILIARRVSPASPWKVFGVTVTYICRNNNEPPDNPGDGHPARNLIGNDVNSLFTFRSVSNNWNQNTTTISIPSKSFFLIANVSTIPAAAGVGLNRVADAYYYLPAGYDPNNLLNAIRSNEPGGIRVTGSQGIQYKNRLDWHDGFAWGNDGSITKAIENIPNSNSFNNGDIFHRLVHKNSDSECPSADTRDMRNAAPFIANIFDRNERLQLRHRQRFRQGCPLLLHHVLLEPGQLRHPDDPGHGDSGARRFRLGQ